MHNRYKSVFSKSNDILLPNQPGLRRISQFRSGQAKNITAFERICIDSQTEPHRYEYSARQHRYSWIRCEGAPSSRLQLSSRLIFEPKDQAAFRCRALCLRQRFTWMKRRGRRLVTIIRRCEFDVSNRIRLKSPFDLECHRGTKTIWLRFTVISSAFPRFRRAAVYYETVEASITDLGRILFVDELEASESNIIITVRNRYLSIMNPYTGPAYWLIGASNPIADRIAG